MKNKINFNHPCFSNNSKESSRIHLPVAQKCNIKCRFCKPTVDSCLHGCRPGLTSNILDAQSALNRLEEIEANGDIIEIIGIAGPGEPLYNKETFETIRLIKNKYPQKHICLSTNGLLLTENLHLIKELNVETITITINALCEEVGSYIYEHINGESGSFAFAEFSKKQWNGLSEALTLGLAVKVNSVYIPKINENDIINIAKKAKQFGVNIHNILPVISHSNNDVMAPTKNEIDNLLKKASIEMEQFTRCKHCRADAIILPKK